MITLATPYVTTTVATINGVATTATTDTLFVSAVNINFSTGVLRAVLQRGTIVSGSFSANQPPIQVSVQPDGTFQSLDGSWKGTINTNALISALASLFRPSNSSNRRSARHRVRGTCPGNPSKY